MFQQVVGYAMLFGAMVCFLALCVAPYLAPRLPKAGE